MPDVVTEPESTEAPPEAPETEAPAAPDLSAVRKAVASTAKKAATSTKKAPAKAITPVSEPAETPAEVPAEVPAGPTVEELQRQLAEARAETEAARAAAEAAKADRDSTVTDLAARLDRIEEERQRDRDKAILELTPIIGSDGMEYDPTQERWVSRTRGREQLWMTDPTDGNRKKAVLVHGGATFAISVADRKWNQAQYRKPEFDPFVNGSFELEAAVSGDLQSETFAARPDLITDERIMELFSPSTPFDVFQAEIAAATNPVVLRRFEHFGMENDGSARRVDAVRARIREIRVAADQRTPPPGWRNPDAVGDMPPPEEVDLYGAAPKGIGADAGF